MKGFKATRWGSDIVCLYTTRKKGVVKDGGERKSR